MRRVTQGDIARELKLSLKTVQRAFNDPQSVSERTRTSVFQFAEAAGYKIDRAAQALQRNTVHRIAILSLSEPAYFWNDLSAGIQLARDQNEYLGFQVVYHRVDSFDTEAFLKIVEDECALGTTAFGLVNHINVEMDRVISRIQRHGATFAAFNTDFPDVDKIAYIGSDDFNQGEIAGEFVDKISCAERPGRIVILNSAFSDVPVRPGTDINRERKEGFLSRLGPTAVADAIEIVIEQDTVAVSWERVKQQLPSRLCRDDVIYCIPPFMDELLDHFSRIEQARRPRIIGHDLSPRIEKYLSQGVITAEIYQNPVLQGYGVVKILENHLERGGLGSDADIQADADADFQITAEVILSSNSRQKNNLDIVSRIG